MSKEYSILKKEIKDPYCNSYNISDLCIYRTSLWDEIQKEFKNNTELQKMIGIFSKIENERIQKN
jgi:hypothetical protein